MPNTAKLHRVLKAPPERVYRAFTEPDALCRWMPPFGWVGKVFSMDVKVGGTFKMSFVNFSNGMEHNFGGEYLEIIPNEKLHYTDTFDDPNIPGTITVTVTFKKVSVGTELTIIQEGLPDIIPLEACYLGWQEFLAQLANLVEPCLPPQC